MAIYEKETLDLLVEHFGVERLIAALPQRPVAELLGLVSMRELADDMEVNYETLRYAMNVGCIPYPEVRLLRRAYYTKEQADRIKKQWKGKN